MDFDGQTYEPAHDSQRLTGQWLKVWQVMARPTIDWWTLREISDATGCPEASVSARLRDFRKPRFGGHFVDRRRWGDPKDGVFEYRLIVRREPEQLELRIQP